MRYTRKFILRTNSCLYYDIRKSVSAELNVFVKMLKDVLLKDPHELEGCLINRPIFSLAASLAIVEIITSDHCV